MAGVVIPLWVNWICREAWLFLFMKDWRPKPLNNARKSKMAEKMDAFIRLFRSVILLWILKGVLISVFLRKL